jgi:hypothetical protein
MDEACLPEGVKRQSRALTKVTPGFYADDQGASYFCPSEFFAVYGLPSDMDQVCLVLDEVMSEFPGITVFEFADPEHP